MLLHIGKVPFGKSMFPIVRHGQFHGMIIAFILKIGLKWTDLRGWRANLAALEDDFSRYFCLRSC